MARYWVGGTATWDGTAGSKWDTVSGGAGGAAVPTAADDVFFDGLSGTGVCTTSSTSVCRSLTCTGYTGTLTIGNVNPSLTVGDASGGAFTLSAGMTFSIAGTSSTIALASSSTNGGAGWAVTTAGKTLPGVNFSNAGGRYILMDALTLNLTINWSSQVTATAYLDTNNQTVTCQTTNGANWHCGSSTVNVQGDINGFGAFVAPTDPGTSHWIIGVNAYRGIGAGTWYDLTFDKPGQGVLYGTTFSCRNLTITGAASRNTLFLLVGNITASGTLTINGNSTVNRILIAGITTAGTFSPGTARTITAATVSVSNADFMDIVGAGAGSWDLSGASGGSGDCLGNSGITFTTPLDRYAVVAGSASSTAMWANTSGGSGGTRVPLPQDDVFFNASSGAGGYTIDLYRFGKNINMTGFTRALQWSNDTTGVACFGSVTLGAAMTWGISSNSFGMWGRGTQTITCNGNAFTFQTNRGMSFGVGGNVSTTISLQDAFAFTNLGNGQFQLLANTTLVTNNNSMTVSLGGTSNSKFFLFGAGCSANFGTSVVTLNGGGSTSGPFDASAASSITADQATFIIGSAQSANRWFGGGTGFRYGELRYVVANSPGQLGISGSNHFGKLSVGPGRTLAIGAGSSQNVDTWDVNGENRNYIYENRNYGGSLTAPDSAALSLQGDMDLRVLVALEDWTPANEQLLIGKRSGASAATVSYYLSVLATTGVLCLRIANGTIDTSATSSVATGLADDTKAWVRGTRQASDGRVQFFTADGSLAAPTSGDWVQLGTNVSNTNAGQNTTDPVFFGGYGSVAGNAADTITGRYYAAQIRNNVLDDGTGIVLDFNLANKPVGANTFVESSVNAATMTISGALAQVGDGRVAIASTTASAAVVAQTASDSYGNRWRYWGTTMTMASDRAILPGASGNYISAADSAALSITGDLDVRVRASLADWTPAVGQGLAGKYLGSGFRSWAFGFTAAPALAVTVSQDGAANEQTATSSALTGFSDGTIGWVRFTWRQSDGRVQFFTAPGSLTSPTAGDFTQLGTDKSAIITSIFDSTSPVEVGSYVNGTTNPSNGSFYALEIRNGIDGTLVANPRFGRGV